MQRIASLLGAVLLVTVASVSQATQTPNIVFILADDLGYGDVKCFGGDQCQIETPNFDRLASEGMRFTDAHANASVCVPTRVAIMTGRYPWRFEAADRGGPWGFLAPRFSSNQQTLGTTLKSAGYKTGYVGKWHLGTEMQTTDGKTQGPTNVDYTRPLKVGPANLGFDESFILPGSLDMYPYAFVKNNMWVGNVHSQKGWSAFNRIGPAADDFEDTKVLSTFCTQAENFIGSAKKEPFFLFVALTSPHTPTSPSKAFQGKSKLGLYGDFVMETDHCVGRVLDALKKHGLDKNTLVIATSDHGPAPYAGRIAKATFGQLKELEKDGHYSTGDYRGYKFSVYEGGLRVPFIARWPGNVPADSTCDRLIGLPDMMATFAEVAGVQLSNSEGVDSFSLVPLLKNPNDKPIRESMILEGTRGMVFRSGSKKLCLCPGSGSEGRYGNTPKSKEAWEAALEQYGKRPKSQTELASAPFVQLYDLENDAHEDKNLAAEQPQIVDELFRTLNEQIAAGRTRGGEAVDGRVVKSIRPPAFVWKPKAAPDANPNPAVSIKQTSDAIEAFCDGQSVLRYNIATQKAPQGIQEHFNRSGYIHPLFTPSGKTVTGDFPEDHPHQHALFNAWTNSTFEGRHVDFWNQAKKLGRVSHQKVISVGKDRFTVELLHEDLTSGDPKPVLKETWSVQVLGKFEDAYVFDIAFVQTCIAKTPLTMNQYRYGGMGIRCHNSWFSKEGTNALKAYEKAIAKKQTPDFPSLELTRHRFVTSEGKDRFAGNHSRPQWVDLSGLVDDKMAGVTIMGHPTNFRFPQPVRLHPSKPYFCFAPMVIGEFKIKPAEQYVAKYRYVVHDGDLNRKMIQSQWTNYKKIGRGLH